MGVVKKLEVGNERMTFSLPALMGQRITRVAFRLGVSRSALVVQLLEQPVADLAELVGKVPERDEDITPEVAMRLRGESAALVAKRIADAVHGVLVGEDDA